MKPEQNYRLRSRPMNNNNRRESTNPLTRSYESNGPEVKIRGTANHIAEKYLQLARDAHTSGNSVAAENYLQHAEHYFRLISAAQAGPRAQSNDSSNDSSDDFGGEDVHRGLPDRFALPEERAPQPSTAQRHFPTPRAVAIGDDENPRQDV